MLYKKYSKKMLCFFWILMIFILFSSKNVYADDFDSHDSYFLVPQIDEDKMKFTFNVMFDSNNYGKSTEQKSNINWGKILNANTTSPSSTGLGVSLSSDENGNITSNSITIESGFNGDSKMGMLSFPAKKPISSMWGGTATAYDQQRAFDIGEKLTNSLNSMLRAIDSIDGKKDIVNTAMLYNGVNEIRPDSNGSDDYVIKEVSGICTIYYGLKLDAIYNNVPLGNPKTGELYAYITTGDNTELDSSAGKFTWAMLKGYLRPDGTIPTKTQEFDDGTGMGTISKEVSTGESYIDGLSKTKLKGGSTPDDAVWITMFNLADIAVTSRYVPQVQTISEFWSNASNPTSVESNGSNNFITNIITELFRTVILGVKTLLGLDSIYDLVYNGGVRGASSYESGMMNNSWWSVMLKYHMIFQIIAWMCIGLAVAKILVDLNLSTINPRTRVFMMEVLQKLFVVGFLLILCIPIIKLLATLNNDIVAVFQTQAQDDADMFTTGSTLASIFAYLSYFGILCVINCTYIMRSIMIAILAASAPLFIVSMIFSKGQGLFTNWFKEISANIFLQSIHAFALAFLFEVLDNGKMIEILVVYFSLLPIVEIFRGLIFGQSGGFASSQGNKVGAQMSSFVNETRKSMANGALGAASNKMNLKKTTNADGNTEGMGSSTSSGSGTGGGGRQPASGAQRFGKALQDKANSFDGKDAGKAKLANMAASTLGGAMNVLSTMDNMGEMAFQSNLGNTQGAMQAGKQVASNIGDATQFMGDSGTRQFNALAYGATKGVGAAMKGNSGLGTMAEARNRYLSYCRGTNSSLSSSGPGYAEKTQANGDKTINFDKSIVGSNNQIKSDKISEWRSSGNEELEKMANSFDGVMLNKTQTGFSYNMSAANRNSQRGYNANDYTQTNKEAGVMFRNGQELSENPIGTKSYRSERQSLGSATNKELYENFMKDNNKAH